VFLATVVAKILYCSPGWSGLCVWLLIVPDSTRFVADASATITVRGDIPAVEDLFSDADDTLFERFVNNNMHVLHSILPQKSVQPYFE